MLPEGAPSAANTLPLWSNVAVKFTSVEGMVPVSVHLPEAGSYSSELARLPLELISAV